MDNNLNPILFNTSPEDAILRIKAGESDSAIVMGLLCLSGIGVKQDLEQASSYFVRAKQLGAKDMDVFIAYIHECNDNIVKAIDTYVGNASPGKKGESCSERMSLRLKKVRSERNRLLKLIKGYGLPGCPLNTSLDGLITEYETGKRSLSDTCAVISLTDENEKWYHDTAYLLYEEDSSDLARLWLKKSNPGDGDELAELLSANLPEIVSGDPVAVELKGGSLLPNKLSIRILPASLISSRERIRKALTDWSKQIGKIKEDYFSAQEARRKAEEEAKKKAAEDKARRKREEGTFIVGRYGRQRDEIIDKTVSRQHCRVTLHDDGMVEIENLSKSNGTVVNGKKIEKVKTSLDSELKMGNLIIKVRDLFPPRKTPTRPDEQTTA